MHTHKHKQTLYHCLSHTHAPLPPTFTDGLVVAPLGPPPADLTADSVAAHLLVAPPAPEGQHAAHRDPRTRLHVERPPPGREQGGAGQTWRGGEGGRDNDDVTIRVRDYGTITIDLRGDGGDGGERQIMR